MSELLYKRFCKSDMVVSRRIGDEHVLVPIHRDSIDVDGFYRLNEVAGEIWDLIDGTRSVAEIRDVLTEEFDVSEETLQSDLIELMHELIRVGALSEVRNGTLTQE